MSRVNGICFPTPPSVVGGSRAAPTVLASVPAMTLELCCPDQPEGKLQVQTDHPKNSRAVKTTPKSWSGT